MGINDARISRLYVTKHGGDVQDATPNAPDQPPNAPAPTFDVTLEMEAGGAVAGQYKLQVVAYDVSAGARNPAMDPPAASNLNGTGAFATAPWQVVLGDWTFDQTAQITVPSNTSGHIFFYTAALMSNNFQIVDVKESEHFVLV